MVMLIVVELYAVMTGNLRPKGDARSPTKKPGTMARFGAARIDKG